MYCGLNRCSKLWVSSWAVRTSLLQSCNVGEVENTCLFCSKYWAFWIWSCVPVMVMIRSSEPSSGSSILMDAPDSWRICLILWPPLPMMEPASCTDTAAPSGETQRECRFPLRDGVRSLSRGTHIFWDGDLCCDDRASNITVGASTTWWRKTTLWKRPLWLWNNNKKKFWKEV